MDSDEESGGMDDDVSMDYEDDNGNEEGDRIEERME